MSDMLYIPDNFPPQGGRGGSNGQGPVNDWQRLTRGRTVGKSTNVYFSEVNVSPPINLLEIGGVDDDAMQLSITLAPPRVLAGTFAGNVENTQGPFYLNGLSNDESAARANPGAVVEWGIGGVQNRAEVDIANGACINIAGSFVRVRPFVDRILGLAVAMPNMLWQVSAFAGPSQPRSSATRTIQIGTLADTVQSALFSVPPYARKVYLAGTPDVITGAAPVMTIQFWRGSNGAGAGFQPVAQFLFAYNSPMAIPVPNGAYYFTVLSGFSGTAFNQVQAVFELGI